jgi:hypothetical protein
MKADEPPSKRQRPVFPEHIDPPKILKDHDLDSMMVASWKLTNPKLKLQLELIAFFPAEEVTLVTTTKKYP